MPKPVCHTESGRQQQRASATDADAVRQYLQSIDAEETKGAFLVQDDWLPLVHLLAQCNATRLRAASSRTPTTAVRRVPEPALVHAQPSLGCILLIDMLYKTSETNVEHPLLHLMEEDYGVYVRVIEDPLATYFYTKLYLFNTEQVMESSAIFCPDYWKPGDSIFNIHDNS
ncbi:hypothetical protein PF004_g11307 [Phytophthora fragariae]|uniref:Uncharacterized protein n=1 Tax=Phytophthora fragariae TaxID=53985 RepID=A0A6G0NYK1_9STRA|nr:hypothetical protein PF004_g11307 [Phytophthora fragariae]